MDARCPLCSSVFQTDRTGVQFCPNCGQQVNVADVSGQQPPPKPSAAGPNFGVPPGPQFGVPPGGGGGSTGAGGFGGGGDSARGPTPWERRSEIGFVAAFFGTLKESMLSPSEFFGRARTSEPVWDAIAFSWLVAAIYTLLSVPLSLAGNGAFMTWYQRFLERMPNVPPELKEQYRKALADATNQGIGSRVAYLVLGLFAVLAGVLFWSVIVHLFAMMTGSAKNGIGATIRSVCYAFAPMIFSFIPCVNIFATVYFIALNIIGLSKLQESSGGKAAAAVLLPMVVFCCCCCGVGAMMGAAMGSALGKMH